MSVRGTHSDRGRLVLGVIVLLVAAAGLTTMGTSAYFTDTDTITGNTFTTGTVALTASPATNAITLTGMVPGDKVTAPITVTNTGTLPQRYSVSSVTTENVFAAQLELTIKTGVTTCTNTSFGTDGSAVYAAGDLGSTAGTKIIGDVAQGPQPTDRPLAPSASEVLCAQVVLPMITDDTFQAKTTTATLTFNAEQDNAATAASVLAGTLTGTTVATSWSAVTGASSYTLSRGTTTGPGAKFGNANDIAVTADGTLYVADTGNNRIRKVTGAGVVTTLAGSGTPGIADGTTVAAEFNQPMGIAVAADGTLYVADSGSYRIRKVTAAGVVTTLAGSTVGFAEGTGSAARFNYPTDVAVTADGSILYVTDATNNRVRKVTAAGVVTTLAGGAYGIADGTGPAAQFMNPAGVTVTADGATVYVGDFTSNRIRRITAAGVVTTLAGSGTAGPADGTGAAAQFHGPAGVTVTADGTTVYVADQDQHRIRKVTTPGGIVTTLAGSTSGFADGTGVAARFAAPHGLAVAADGTVFVMDSSNQKVRKVTAGGVVTTQAGSTYGFAESTTVWSNVYTGSALSYPDTGLLAGTSYTHRVTAVGSAALSNTIGPFMPSSVLGGGRTGTTVDASWTAVLGATSYTLNRLAATTGPVQLSNPEGVAVDTAGIRYVADTGNNRIRKISAAGVVTTLAGSTAGFADGTGGAARFTGPRGIAVAADGSFIYVADSGNHLIRKISAAGVVTTLAGSTQGSANGTGVAATFNGPAGVAVHTSGTVYVADTGNHRIRQISAAGVVTNLAGSTVGTLDGTYANTKFNTPTGVAVSNVDGVVYVADKNNFRLRQLSAGSSGTVAGYLTSGYLDGTGVGSRFATLTGVALGPSDDLYVADTGNQRIRKVTQMAVVTTVAGTSTAGFADTVMVVSSVVYTGPGLSYSNTGLLLGTSYTYTLTAVGTVSNTIGPFVPVGPVTYTYSGGAHQFYTVPPGVFSLAVVALGSPNIGTYGGGYASGNLTVTPGQVLDIFVQNNGRGGVDAHVDAPDLTRVLSGFGAVDSPSSDVGDGYCGLPMTGCVTLDDYSFDPASVTITP